MRKATLQFLHRECDELRTDVTLLQAGRREVVELSPSGRKNVTVGCLEQLLDRLGRFEEMIAAYQVRLS